MDHRWLDWQESIHRACSLAFLLVQASGIAREIALSIGSGIQLGIGLKFPIEIEFYQIAPCIRPHIPFDIRLDFGVSLKLAIGLGI